MTAGRSAAAWARELRRARPWWRRLLAALGLCGDDPAAAQCAAGSAGEQLTAELLAPLTTGGWHILHDRAIPGSRANLDHVLVPPHGLYVIVLDSKLWSRHKGTLHVQAGRLCHGGVDRHRAVETVRWEAGRAGDLLGVPAVPLIVMHSAPVAAGWVKVSGVAVVEAAGLLSVLEAHAGTHGRDRVRADRLAVRAERVLPAYG